MAENSKLEAAKGLALVAKKRSPDTFVAMWNKVQMKFCIKDALRGFAQVWLHSCRISSFLIRNVI